MFRRILLLTDGSSPSSPIELQWEYHYKDLKGSPLVKFDPNYIEVHLKVGQSPLLLDD